MWTDQEVDAVVVALRHQFTPYVPHWAKADWEAVAAAILEAAENARHS